jgi:flagellar M-ring protein FliF
VESPDYLPYIILGAILLLVLVVALIRRSPRRKEEAVLAPAAAGLDITVGDELAPELSEADKELRELRNKVANIAQEKPRDVAQLIRTWLAEE